MAKRALDIMMVTMDRMTSGARLPVPANPIEDYYQHRILVCYQKLIWWDLCGMRGAN